MILLALRINKVHTIQLHSLAVKFSLLFHDNVGEVSSVPIFAMLLE
jgi:hypothetical protein